MKTTFNTAKLLTASALTTAMAVPVAFAGSSYAPTPLPQGMIHAVVGVQASEAGQLATVSGNKLIGMDVENKQGQQLGEIVDVVVNSQSGQIQYLVLSDEGGVLDLRSQMYAVPWSEFSLTNEDDGNVLLLDTTAEKLNQAKPLGDSQWPTSVKANNWDQPDKDRANERDSNNRGADLEDELPPDVRNDNIRPQNVEDRSNADRSDNDEGINIDADISTDDDIDLEGDDVDVPDVRNDRIRPSGTESERDARTVGDRESSTDVSDKTEESADNRQRNRTDTPDVRNEQIRPGNRQEASNDREAWRGNATKDNQFDYETDSERSIQTDRLSDLIGMDVQGEGDTTLGEIEDVVIDTKREKIVYAKIGYGGSLFAEQDTVYVPYEKLQLNPMKDQFTAKMTEQELIELEQSQEDNPDVTSQSFGEELYTSFDSEPYWEHSNDNAAEGVAPVAVIVYEIEPLTQKQREQRAQQSQQAWKSDSKYNQSYDPEEAREISGTVTSVGSYRPTAGAESGLRFRVHAEDGNSYVIHAGPRSFTKQKNFMPTYGDEVTIEGSAVQCDGRDVIVAREIQTEEQTVTLRDQQGDPQWDNE